MSADSLSEPELDILSSSPADREARAQKLANLFVGKLVPLLVHVGQDFYDKSADETIYNCRTWRREPWRPMG
jgi:hypothetical protein